MRSFFDSFRLLKPQQTFEREIAPGVHVHVRPAPHALNLATARPIANITHRMHDAWDVLWGKAHATAQHRIIEQRLRRAA